MKKLLLSIPLLILLIVVIGFAFIEWYPNSNTRNNKVIPLTIPHGITSQNVAQQLKNAGIISNAKLFWAYYQIHAKISGTTLKAGEYNLTPDTTIGELFNIISSGKVVRHFITIPEGLSSIQIASRLSRNKKLTGEITLPEEGTILPETYEFHKFSKRQNVISSMQKAQQNYMQEAWKNRTLNIPKINTPEKAIIMASIVEKETGYKGERKKVASVFINRLRKGMKLQSDPTIIYGITKGKPLKRRIRKSEIIKKTDWNTYTIEGLPKTAICHPGKKAIDAVLNPIETDYLFFVADGTGGHYFSKSNREHERAVKRWREYEKEKGLR